MNEILAIFFMHMANVLSLCINAMSKYIAIMALRELINNGNDPPAHTLNLMKNRKSLK